MNRKIEIENSRRVSKCGARHMKPFPVVVMTPKPLKETRETVKKNHPRQVEPVKEQESTRQERKEPESLFDFRKGRRENVETEDEQ